MPFYPFTLEEHSYPPHNAPVFEVQAICRPPSIFILTQHDYVCLKSRDMKPWRECSSLKGILHFNINQLAEKLVLT